MASIQSKIPHTMNSLAKDWGFKSPESAHKFFSTAYANRTARKFGFLSQIEKGCIMDSQSEKFTFARGNKDSITLRNVNKLIDNYDSHNHPVRNLNDKIFEKINVLPSNTDIENFFTLPSRLSAVTTPNFIALMKRNTGIYFSHPSQYKHTPVQYLKENLDQLKFFTDAFKPKWSKVKALADSINTIKLNTEKFPKEALNPHSPKVIELTQEAVNKFGTIGEIIGSPFKVLHWDEIFPKKEVG